MKGKAGLKRMGKNKSRKAGADPMKEKTQELEETKRISKGIVKSRPQFSK